MKYNLIGKIENVKRSIPFKDGVMFSTKDDSVFFEDKEVLKNVDGASMFKISESLIQIWDKESGYYYFNSDIIKSDYFVYLNKNSNRVVAETKPRRIARGVYKRDICFLKEDLINVDELLLENVDESIVTFNDNILILGSKNNLHAYTLPAAQPLWRFDTAELGMYDKLYSSEKIPYEVSKFLGVWQNELLVASEGGLIFSLDINTGKLVRKWCGLPDHVDSDIKEVFRGNLHQSGYVYQLNLLGNKVIAIYFRHIIEVDLLTGEIQVKDLSESLYKNNMNDFQLKSGYAEDETHYYTTVHFDKSKLALNYIPTAVCAVNKSTLEIDWYYRFDEDGKGDYVSIQVPQVSYRKLYQLTASNILHIFQKES